MKVTRAILAVAAAFAVVTTTAGVASANPPPWNDGLHAQAAGAEGRANNWAGSMGRSGPGWKHVYNPSEVTCPPPAGPAQLAWFCSGPRIVDVTPNAIISWNGAGPAGVDYLMGHETTHSFQPAGGGGPAKEQQASCGGGVFMKWLGTPPGDAERVFTALRGGSGNDNHGPMGAMADNARTGYDAGHLGACGL